MGSTPLCVMASTKLVLALCLAMVCLAAGSTDELRDLSLTEEPQMLDAASPLSAKQPSDLGEDEEEEEDEGFGFGGMSTQGNFVMSSTVFEEELGEGEETGFGFGGMSTQG